METEPSLPDRLRTHVETLCNDFFPRDSSHPGNLQRAAEHIRSAFEQFGLSPVDQAWQAGGETYLNVLAQVGPETSERIVIGAHYDTAGPQPGADDNASGVAALFELARTFARRPPPMRVELAAYCLEESPYCRTPCMGSAVHAESLRRAWVRVKLMISLEMIGYFSDAPESQRYPVPGMGLFYPTRGNFIAVVGILGQSDGMGTVVRSMRNASPLPVRSLKAHRGLPGVERSDHMNFWDQGYHALMITDTAEFRNANYHSVTDEPETLDYRRMAYVVQGIEAAVRRLAGPSA